MIELELEHRRLYALDGVGTLRLNGLASRSAVAEAGDASWRISRRQFWRRVIEAVDAEGRVVGEFEPRGGAAAGGAGAATAGS